MVHFFRNVVGVAAVDKDVLGQRTVDYQDWVEAYACNHRLLIEWAEKGMRKEDHVLPWQRRMAQRNAYGSFSFQEHGAGRHLSGQRAEIPLQGPQLADPCVAAYSVYLLLFIHSRRGVGPDRHAGGLVLFVSDQLLSQWPQRAGVEACPNGFRKADNAFLAVDDVTALQAAADKLSVEIIRQRLDYWTLVLGPKFSAKEREQFYPGFRRGRLFTLLCDRPDRVLPQLHLQPQPRRSRSSSSPAIWSPTGWSPVSLGRVATSPASASC